MSSTQLQAVEMTGGINDESNQYLTFILADEEYGIEKTDFILLGGKSYAEISGKTGLTHTAFTARYGYNLRSPRGPIPLFHGE